MANYPEGRQIDVKYPFQKLLEISNTRRCYFSTNFLTVVQSDWANKIVYKSGNERG